MSSTYTTDHSNSGSLTQVLVDTCQIHHHCATMGTPTQRILYGGGLDRTGGGIICQLPSSPSEGRQANSSVIGLSLSEMVHSGTCTRSESITHKPSGLQVGPLAQTYRESRCTLGTNNTRHGKKTLFCKKKEKKEKGKENMQGSYNRSSHQIIFVSLLAGQSPKAFQS